MLPPVPRLADYGISPTHGFLPDVLPLTRLPDPYYNKWEAVVANLQALVLSRRLRPVVDRLPVLSTIGLEHDAEWRRAYSLLCFMAHAYIWGGDSPSDRLPPPLAAPLIRVAARLEVPPVATYAAVCLWNFKPLFVDEPLDLENLATLTTFTGSLDESWFYLVSVAIEARGAPIIPLMLTAVAAAREGDSPSVTRCLRAFAERLTDLTDILARLHDSCDPTVFYHRIRPFLAGSKNMAEAGLPDGVYYDDGSGRELVARQYSGGSNAQSSLLQFFDVVLGIVHRPTGEKPPRRDSLSESSDREGPTPRHNFIADMRNYMPGPHARFLRDVGAVANIREFVEARPDDRELRLAYDACLAMLSAFRDRHIAIVTRYIVVPSREVRARSRSRSPEAARRRVNLATATRQLQQTQTQVAADAPAPAATGKSEPQGVAAGGGRKIKGTGGTALIPFLKQARDETGEPAVEDWARRFMSRQGRAQGRGDFFFGKPELAPPPAPEEEDVDDVDIGGLAGSWAIDDEVGGICNY